MMVISFKRRVLRSFTALLLFVTAVAELCAASEVTQKWKNGPWTNANYFPIAVWVQDPKNAERYKAAGINLYVALWRGPTSNQLALLEKAGMRVICSQNAAALEHT